MVAILYHCVGARSLRPLWTLEELGLRYELRVLPFPPRLHDKSIFSVNPTGTVPVFVDGDLRMTESVAICAYLAARFDPGGLTVRPDEPAYGAYLEWSFYGEASLTYPITVAFRYSRLEFPARRLPQAVEDYRRVFLSRLQPVIAALDGRRFLCADRFTVADVSVGYALMLAKIAGLDADLPDAVRAYRAMLEERPAFQRARATEKPPMN